MTFADFRKLLDFLATKITTRLLFYNSCYAAGLNAQEIYKSSESAIQQTYPFAIITQALTDASVSKEPIYAFDTQLIVAENFTAFLKKIRSPHSIDYENVTQDIGSPHLPASKSYTFSFGSLAQIKLPGLEWFSVLESHKNIVSIGSILSKTRAPSKPLDVVKFFKTDPRGILLYGASLSFDLIIDSKNLEAIISMIPGPATHAIKKIIAPKKSIEQVLSWFTRIEDLKVKKIFFIENINNEVMNVLICNEYDGKNSLRYGFFDSKGTIFMKKITDLDEAPEEASSAEKILYTTKLNEIQKKVHAQQEEGMGIASKLRSEDIQEIETILRPSWR